MGKNQTYSQIAGYGKGGIQRQTSRERKVKYDAGHERIFGPANVVTTEDVSIPVVTSDPRSIATIMREHSISELEYSPGRRATDLARKGAEKYRNALRELAKGPEGPSDGDK